MAATHKMTRMLGELGVPVHVRVKRWMIGRIGVKADAGRPSRLFGFKNLEFFPFNFPCAKLGLV